MLTSPWIYGTPKFHHPSLNKDLLKTWLKTGDERRLHQILSDMDPGTFIIQPGNTQEPPDILLRSHRGHFVPIECKSVGDATCPVWNDTSPHQHAVYIFSSGRVDQTTIFMGCDVITLAMYDLHAELEQKMRDLVDEYRDRAQALDEFDRGWVMDFRRKHSQAGGARKTNWFTHRYRHRCEQRALDAINAW